VAGSCMPLDLAAIQRTEATAIFAGTVTRTEAGHVWVQVEQWFLGKEPVGSAEVIGGSQPNAITSADWVPSPGEQYLVVAERAAPTGFVTRLCQQTPVSVALLQQAATVFGVPREGPFETPTPGAGEPAPGAAQVSSSSLVLPVLLLAAAAATVIVVAFVRRRRRAL
jgi:hypothetical protein